MLRSLVLAVLLTLLAGVPVASAQYWSATETVTVHGTSYWPQRYYPVLEHPRYYRTLATYIQDVPVVSYPDYLQVTCYRYYGGLC